MARPSMMRKKKDSNLRKGKGAVLYIRKKHSPDILKATLVIQQTAIPLYFAIRNSDFEKEKKEGLRITQV